MKTKSLVIILLLMFLSSIAMANTMVIATGETPIELVEEIAEPEGSESTDELKIFYHQLLTESVSNKSSHNFGETTVVLQTLLQGLYRPPKFS